MKPQRDTQSSHAIFPPITTRQCTSVHVYALGARISPVPKVAIASAVCRMVKKKYFALRGACLLLGASTQLQYTLVSTTVAAATQSYCDVTMINASCLTPCEKDCETTFVNFGAVSLFSCVSSDELHSTCFTKTNNTHFFVHQRQCNFILDICNVFANRTQSRLVRFATLQMPSVHCPAANAQEKCIIGILQLICVQK